MINIKKRRITIVLLIALFSVIYFNIKKKTKESHYISASWEYNYEDIQEISQDSDFIAIISVNTSEKTELNESIPYTIFSASVITPIYNAKENQEILIYMTGGETKDGMIEVEDDPLLLDGEEALVFCKENADGTYRILSGPQGRLLYENGKLNSLNVVNSRVRQANSFSNIVIQNVDADILIDEIKNYVGNNN